MRESALLSIYWYCSWCHWWPLRRMLELVREKENCIGRRPRGDMSHQISYLQSGGGPRHRAALLYESFYRFRHHLLPAVCSPSQPPWSPRVCNLSSPQRPLSTHDVWSPEQSSDRGDLVQPSTRARPEVATRKVSTPDAMAMGGVGDDVRAPVARQRIWGRRRCGWW
jgi:hypothetical protein